MSKQHNFLLSLAETCKEQFGDHCDQLTVIFPNKRAGLYFAKYLSAIYEKPIWSPNICSLEEYVEVRQNATLGEELQLNLMLYQNYQKLIPGAESFDAFMPWGEMILKDFNDIDNYLVDPAHIFKVVKSQKELDESFDFLSERDQKIIQRFWQGFLPTPSGKQDEFIKTWSILHQLYESFNASLTALNLTYKGHMFRDFSERHQPVDRVWFAGFNALTAAEEKIIKSYLSIPGNDIFWDLDEYYFVNPDQESGTFFREYAKDNTLSPSIQRDVRSVIGRDVPKVELISGTFGMGQVMATVQNLRNKINDQEPLDDTLIVLADETLLTPLTRHLPTGLEKVNISMGWPINSSPIFLLISQVVSLKSFIQQDDFRSVTYEQLNGILEFRSLLGLSEQSYQQFIQSTLDTNQLYFTLAEVTELLAPLKGLIEAHSIDEVINELTLLLSNLDTQLLQTLDQAVRTKIYHDLKHLQQAFRDGGTGLSFRALERVVHKLGQTGKVPLSGDPMEGLQVMGVLETRNLSFKNVMILGMNEGTWPKDSSNSSFIPYNIRKAFELPTIEHQDAMQSYLFYRLLHSAENLWISYNNVSEYNRNGELSRFVQQLKHESSSHITEKTIQSPIHPDKAKSLTIEKNEHVLQQLNSYLTSDGNSLQQLSPSALNTYLDCRLRFYFQYVERIREPDELIFDIEPSLLGNLLHGTMEHLYASGGIMTEEKISALEPGLEEALQETFTQEKMAMGEGKQPIGRQAIAYEVVKQFAQAILKYDKRHAGFEILALEKEYRIQLPIETPNGTRQVVLKGIIDRVDRLNGIVRVMDYKSGRDERTFENVPTLFDREIEKRGKAVFQLFYYSLLYSENQSDRSPIRPGLFNSRDLFSEDFDTLISQKENRKSIPVLGFDIYQEEFQSNLLSLVSEIFDPSINFDQTTDEKKCSYCPYKQICKRG